PDGSLWFTENTGNRIGRITTAGAITEQPLPFAAAGAEEITTGPDRNLWFAEASGKLGELVPAPVNALALPSQPAPSAVGAGPRPWRRRPPAPRPRPSPLCGPPPRRRQATSATSRSGGPGALRSPPGTSGSRAPGRASSPTPDPAPTPSAPASASSRPAPP